MESVDTQDVKALSNDHIKAQEMCRAACFNYIFLYGWVEFNLLMFSSMTTLALHGSFCLIGLFQMHKTPVILTTCHYSIRLCRELEYLIKKTNIKFWFVHSDHLSLETKGQNAKSFVKYTLFHFVRSLFGNAFSKQIAIQGKQNSPMINVTHHTLNTHSTKKKCVC